MILPWRMLTVTSLEKKEGEIPSYPLAPNPGRIFFSLLLFLMLLTPVWGQELPDVRQHETSDFERPGIYNVSLQVIDAGSEELCRKWFEYLGPRSQTRPRQWKYEPKEGTNDGWCSVSFSRESDSLKSKTPPSEPILAGDPGAPTEVIGLEFKELPDAPSEVKSNVDKQPHQFPVTAEGVRGVPKAAKTPSGHNWFYRHPILTGSIIGGGIALGWGLTHRNSCPHYINGYGYDGTPPCPKSCEGPGDCYWGPKK